jgi:hypothetical protein
MAALSPINQNACPDTHPCMANAPAKLWGPITLTAGVPHYHSATPEKSSAWAILFAMFRSCINNAAKADRTHRHEDACAKPTASGCICKRRIGAASRNPHCRERLLRCAALVARAGLYVAHAAAPAQNKPRNVKQSGGTIAVNFNLANAAISG